MVARPTWVSLALVAACSPAETGGTPGGALLVEGTVVDFVTGEPLEAGASVSTSGLRPAPTVTVTGAAFAIEGVPEHSAFHVLASAPPGHRATFSPAIEVTDRDRDDVVAYAVAEPFLAELSTEFGVTPTARRGVLMVRLVDDLSEPRAGVAAAELLVDGAAVDGPYFLDAAGAPDAALTASSASGWAVFFEVDTGLTGFTAPVAPTVTLDLPVSPIAAGAVTIATATVTAGAPPPLPTGVSFAEDVFPIFDDRGCVACHSGNGIGRDLGGLTLDGSANLVYRELVEEAPGRVVPATPATSMLLTYPSAEDPPDGHPTVTFASALDPDYRTILGWITEGGLDN